MTVERSSTDGGSADASSGGTGNGDAAADAAVATDTGAEPEGTPTYVEVPPMVSLALRAALAQIVVMGLATVATYFLRDTLRDAWLTARAVSTGQTLDAVRESAVEAPHFFPVALTMFVTYVGLALVLIVMVRVGARWALYSLTALVVLSGLQQVVVGTTPGAPTLIMLLTAASVALHGLTVLLLWHPANAGYFRNAHNGHWAKVIGDD